MSRGKFVSSLRTYDVSWHFQSRCVAWYSLAVASALNSWSTRCYIEATCDLPVYEDGAVAALTSPRYFGTKCFAPRVPIRFDRAPLSLCCLSVVFLLGSDDN